ncbi:nucleotidyltransferase family protein [Phreatobacter stygius]|uniref:Nucleotidyltransferase family protein n=1 Tax=Phreatobacter stygius TaxID=1940610 RepID=A0A4D7AWD6_9HYPH|nr:nucleotidyltransferase family protein [Phreatobacter stygius]QCI63178.1 nucleotidyltransferase family protein [Phreatobacter stygius]
MRALLLAAGLGTRLRPLTLTVPKCLVPVHGKPLLGYWLEHLFAGGIERVLINTHWLALPVRDYVAASPWRSRIDLVHEEELLGTGGTVLANRDWLNGAPFLLAHADNLTDFDVSTFRRRHEDRPKGCAMSMLAFRTDDPRSCGVLELDAACVLQAFHEKVPDPPGNLANAAVYICEPEIAEFIASLGKPIVDFSTEVIPRFIGETLAVETSGYHRDIGSPASLKAAEREYRPHRDAADKSGPGWLTSN